MVLPGVVDLGLGGMQMGWGHQDRGPWSLPLISLAAFWVLKLTDRPWCPSSSSGDAGRPRAGVGGGRVVLCRQLSLGPSSAFNTL